MPAKYVVYYLDKVTDSTEIIEVNNFSCLVNLGGLLQDLKYTFAVLDTEKNANAIIMKSDKLKRLFKNQTTLKKYNVIYI